jgi:hypothetical protein
MESLERIDNLARRARAETPPLTDVPVEATVRGLRGAPQAAFSLAWPAVVSAIAACAMLAMSHRAAATTATTTAADPVAAMFNSVQVEMP